MPKPLRASIIASVSIQMMVNDEDKLTDGVETLEDGIKYALGDELFITQQGRALNIQWL
jgi:hypothetical protein